MIKLKNIVIDLLNEGIKLKDIKVNWLKDKPDLTDAQIDYYWNKINAYNSANNNKIKLLKTPFKEIEKIVDANFSKKSISIIDTDYKEYAKKNGLVVYDQNNMMIVRSDSKESCVILGKGENWCISRSDASNMYYGYKYGYGEPTFYFSYDFDKLEQNKDDVNGILVIMVNNEGKYTVADRDNDTNSGNEEVRWDYISKLQPKLKSIKSVFKKVEVSRKERNKYERIKEIDRLYPEEKLEAYKELDYDDKSLYIDINHNLRGDQFWVTPKDIQEKYIKIGGYLSKENMVQLPNNLRKVLNDVISEKIARNIAISKEEFDYLEETGGDKILISYIETDIEKGFYLNDFQLKYLVKNNKEDFISKYIYKKVKNSRFLQKPELDILIDSKYDEILMYYFKEIIREDIIYLDYFELDYLLKKNKPELVKRALDKLTDRRKHLNRPEIEYLGKNYEDILLYYINNLINKDVTLDNFEIFFLIDNNKHEILMNYLNKKIEDGKILYGYEIRYLSKNKENEFLKYYLDEVIRKGIYLDTIELNSLVNNNENNFVMYYINKKLDKKGYINCNEIRYLIRNKEEDTLLKFINLNIKNKRYLDNAEFICLTENGIKFAKYYLEKKQESGAELKDYEKNQLDLYNT